MFIVDNCQLQSFFDNANAVKQLVELDLTSKKKNQNVVILS